MSAFDPKRTLAISRIVYLVGVFAGGVGWLLSLSGRPTALFLIAGGIALLLLAVSGAGMAATNANHYRIPVLTLVFIAGSGDAILGAALLFVALRRSQFAGATAVIVATVMTFGIVAKQVISLFFATFAGVTWWTAVYLAIAAGLIGPSLFPWSWNANKPVLFWMALTVAALIILIGGLALLARI